MSTKRERVFARLDEGASPQTIHREFAERLESCGWLYILKLAQEHKTMDRERPGRSPAWAQAFRLFWRTHGVNEPEGGLRWTQARTAFRQGWIASGLERARRVRVMRTKGTHRTREQHRAAALLGRQQ